jgi:hypothetical protein
VHQPDTDDVHPRADRDVAVDPVGGRELEVELNMAAAVGVVATGGRLAAVLPVINRALEHRDAEGEAEAPAFERGVGDDPGRDRRRGHA